MRERHQEVDSWVLQEEHAKKDKAGFCGLRGHHFRPSSHSVCCVKDSGSHTAPKTTELGKKESTDFISVHKSLLVSLANMPWRCLGGRSHKGNIKG